MTLARCFSLLVWTCALKLTAAEPAFEWVAAGGGLKNDKTRAVTVDAKGNVLIAGETNLDGTFGDLKRQGLGSTDMFLAKVSPEGRFLWVKSLGGSLVDRAYGVVTDGAGNVYVTGHFQSTDAQALGQTMPNVGDYDLFVAKYDSEGELLWIRTGGGAGYDYGHGIALDSRGDVVISGAVAGEARFGEVTVNPGSSSRGILWAKYGADGSLKWVRTTTGGVSGSGHGISVDGQDNLYIGGSASGKGVAGKLQINPQGGSAALAMKVSPDGEPVWATSIPSTTSAVFHEITCDAQGRVWGAGIFKGKVTADQASYETTGPKDSDGLVVHLSPEGKVLWSHAIQGPGVDYGLGVATDGTGRVFLTGEFSATAALAGKKYTSQGATDIFTAAFDEKGRLEWLVANGGPKGDSAYTVVWRPGYLILGGSCSSPAVFGSKKVETDGTAEAYTAKLLLHR